MTRALPSTPADHVVIHTDGGCEGNPGPGGWAAVLRHGESVREISGGEIATTNNRMELRAAIEALRSLERPSDVRIFTDSEYLRNGITSWIKGWKVRGWLTAAKQPVRNADLWRELDSLVARHRIHWGWLKGHAGHQDNERCDVLAAEEMKKIRQKHSPAELKTALATFKGSAGPTFQKSPARLHQPSLFD
ncbi:MAG: ribonuclease HI [Verrucomicrobia bacterium]|nr:ribonuclease HI [Verrucomicrobiota bacterium]